MSARIAAADVGVRFQLDRQHRPVTPTLARLRRRCTTFWALRGISFEIEPGAGVALIGPNGAGKTTLLRLMAGVLVPDEGEVLVHGRIGSLLSVDAGLMPVLTGRENAVLLGALPACRRGWYGGRSNRSAPEPAWRMRSTGRCRRTHRGCVRDSDLP